jgi:pimeloyl-ACP methyl ester carboxylesterase
MMKRKFCLLLIAVVFFAVALTQCSQEQVRQTGVFVEAPCPFTVPEGLTAGKDFTFGYVDVPEMHGQPEGPTIRLAVAVFHCTGDNPAPDPIVLNTGGPGKSNMDNFFPDLASELGALILPERDAVLIELRGLRYSQPNLICREVANAQIAMITKNLAYEEEKEVIVEALTQAKKRFVSEGVNLSAFNNIETVSDIDLIMTELGYDHFNMVGSSAGTMVAQHMIRDYPERLRCVILDAGLPINSGIFQNMVPNGIDRLKATFQMCREDADCREACPNLEERFLDLLTELEKNPVPLQVQDPETGEEYEYILNGRRLGAFVFFNMYFNPQVPQMINKVLNGDYSDVVKGVKESFLLGRTFAFGLGYTVISSESDAFDLGDIEIDPRYKVLADGVTLGGIGGEFIYEARRIWEIEPIAKERREFKEKSSVPVLVLNGLYDHVIPPKYDEEMKGYLDNCYIYRFGDVTHSVADGAPECAIPMILQFLSDPSQAPDSSCAEGRELKFLTSEPGN